MDCDFVVIGSGFGGSVAALRLAEKGYRVVVLEAGRRWQPQDFPRSNWSLHRFLWLPKVGLRGFFAIHPFRHVTVLRGVGVGGGSLTYAATLLEPAPEVWGAGSWAGLADWTSDMPGHFATAGSMLGVVRNTVLGAADMLLRDIADAAGCGASWGPTDVGLLLPAPGEAGGRDVGDPFFGGRGPARTTCIGCGGCMVGCRHGAKNTLDRNYLHLAERLGVAVRAECTVTDVRPLPGSADGAAGYAVRYARSGSWLGFGKGILRCRGVVFAASALGTTRLLLRLKECGALPMLSQRVGDGVRINAEALVGLRFPGGASDLSRGVAIGSQFRLDSATTVEATRYPGGSDAMGTLVTLLPDRRRFGAGAWAWLRAALHLAHTRPIALARMLLPFGFARETLILLVMRTVEGCLALRLRRRWWWPFSTVLVTEGPRIPAYIPGAHAVLHDAAARLGGIAGSLATETLFDIPTTAHLLGGALIGADPQSGVVDADQRVFGYRDMFVCDGSVIAANLGVNPSLTIAALAERAMSRIPPATRPP